jgi:DNA polymerase I-like protein with 3'-5' exonuclease and polymerase domains
MPRLREFRYDRWASWAVGQVEQDRPGVIAYDTETTGLGFYDRPFGATVSWRAPGGGASSARGELKSAYFDLEGNGWEERARALGQVLRGTPAWVAHNAKFDQQKLLLIGAITWDDIARAELHDTQTIYHLLDENGRKGLKHLAVAVLGWDDTIEVEVKSGPNKGTKRAVPKEEHRLAEARRKLKLRKDDGYHLLPREVLIPYALRDTDFTLRLYEELMPRLERKNDPALLEAYRTEMDVQLVLLRMEQDGFALDLEYLDEVTSDYGVQVMEAWNEVVALTGNPDLNPNAPAQLLDAFRQRGQRLESTDRDTLAGLDDDLARAILRYRDVKKIHTTYLRPLQEEQRDGIAHPNFNPTGARSGRMSSGGAKE